MRIIIWSGYNYSVEYWKLQMADLAVRKRKQTVTQERKLFSEIHKWNTFVIQRRDLAGKFNLLHTRRRLALE